MEGVCGVRLGLESFQMLERIFQSLLFLPQKICLHLFTAINKCAC